MRRARRVSARGVSASRDTGFCCTDRAYGSPPTSRVAVAASDLAYGMMACEMIGFTLLLFPFVVLGFVLLMGRVEEPLRQVSVEREIEHFLDTANQSELDTFVREGTDSALHRFRTRLGLRRRHRGVRRTES